MKVCANDEQYSVNGVVPWYQTNEWPYIPSVHAELSSAHLFVLNQLWTVLSEFVAVNWLTKFTELIQPGHWTYLYSLTGANIPGTSSAWTEMTELIQQTKALNLQLNICSMSYMSEQLRLAAVNFTDGASKHHYSLLVKLLLSS